MKKNKSFIYSLIVMAVMSISIVSATDSVPDREYKENKIITDNDNTKEGNIIIGDVDSGTVNLKIEEGVILGAIGKYDFTVLSGASVSLMGATISTTDGDFLISGEVILNNDKEDPENNIITVNGNGKLVLSGSNAKILVNAMNNGNEIVLGTNNSNVEIKDGAKLIVERYSNFAVWNYNNEGRKVFGNIELTSAGSIELHGLLGANFIILNDDTTLNLYYDSELIVNSIGGNGTIYVKDAAEYGDTIGIGGDGINPGIVFGVNLVIDSNISFNNLFDTNFSHIEFGSVVINNNKKFVVGGNRRFNADRISLANGSTLKLLNGSIYTNLLEMRDEELGGLLLIGDNNARVVVDKIDNINLTIDKDVNASMTFSDVTTSHFYTVTVNSGATLGLGNTTVNSIRLNDGSTLKLSGELLINGTLHIIGEESANLIILNSDANIILNEEAYIVDRDSFLNIQIGDDNNKVNYRDNTLFSSIGEYVKNITINRGSTLSLGKDNIIENGGDFTVKGTLNLGTGTLDVNTFIVSDGAIVTLHIDKNEKYGKIIAGTYNISKNNTILKLFLDYVPSVGDEEIELNMFGGDVVFGSSPKNILYNFEYVGEGTYKMTRKKIGDVANEIGISENNQQTLSVWGDLVDTEVGHKLNLLLISDDIEVNRDELIRNLTLLAPDESPMVQSSAASTFNMVASAVGTRLSGGLGSPALGGLSSGDTFVGKNIWVQGLYNVSKLDNSFDSSTRGAALGLEGKFNNYFTAGIGYAYTDSDVDGERNTDIITNTFFLYGEYNDPLSFFVNGMISFGTSKYNEIKKINIGNLLAKYDANTLAFQAKIGYEVSNEIVNITRAISVRYISTNTKPYTDILKQEVSSNRATTLTGLINLKFDREFIVTKDFILRPEIIAGIGYDFVNEGGSSVVKLTDKYSYTIKEQTLKKTLYEVGVGINGNISRNLNLSINYDRQIRTDYVDNTFVVNIRYNF